MKYQHFSLQVIHHLYNLNSTKFSILKSHSNCIDFNSINFCFAGTDDDLIATLTIILLHQLEKGDQIFVTVQKEKDHGESKLVSNSQSAGIHFSGLKISN